MKVERTFYWHQFKFLIFSNNSRRAIDKFSRAKSYREIVFYFHFLFLFVWMKKKLKSFCLPVKFFNWNIHQSVLLVLSLSMFATLSVVVVNINFSFSAINSFIFLVHYYLKKCSARRSIFTIKSVINQSGKKQKNSFLFFTKSHNSVWAEKLFHIGTESADSPCRLELLARTNCERDEAEFCLSARVFWWIYCAFLCA